MSLFRKPLARVAINLRPRRGSWGGANQWTSQLSHYLASRGYAVTFDLRREVDGIVMTHAGLSSETSFGVDEVRRYRERYPRTPCLHRINDNDVRKGTDKMDALLARSNTVADHTVFVSEWLRDHHARTWFSPARPHSVIEPGADNAVFHPFGNQPPRAGEPFRIVTHHWSDNWAKGFDVYQEIDRCIAEKEVEGFELWIIGRWPKEITWRAARTFAPCSGPALAELLRQCHLYVSASRHEPGAMHPVEGLQCGLPLIYHADSGGTVQIGRRYGICLGDSVAATLRETRERYRELRANLLAAPPSGDWMCLQYHRLVQALICQFRELS